MINADSIPYWRIGLMVPCGKIICITNLVSHNIHVAESNTMTENRFDLSLQINNMFKIPKSTKDKEKKTFIARMAVTNSVALLSI